MPAALPCDRSGALPRRPSRSGRRGWSAVWIALAWAAVAVAGETVPVAARLTVNTVDGGQVTGEIVVEAVDGGVLLERDDGRYELLQPDRIAARSAVAAATPQSPQDIGRRILAELPPGFELLVTKHYIVCYDTSRDYAKWSVAVFERLHDAFGNYWTRAGIEVHDPPRPLVVVIFADRRAYEAHAAEALGGAAGRVAGYYDMLSNRVTTYDLTGSDALTAARGRRAGSTGLAILSSPEAAGLVATLVHEATHQLAFNAGLHRRLAPVPVWVSEGIATYFETPDLQNARGWKGIGEVNLPRLDRFLAASRPGVLESIVRADDAFRNPDAALDAYATAWATTHHLLQSRKAEFVAYIGRLAAKRPLQEDSPEERMAEFRAAFGDPGTVERDVFEAAARLASRRR